MPHFKSEFMEKYLGLPDENPELYAERNPINYVVNVAATLLMLHGINDSRADFPSEAVPIGIGGCWVS